MKPVELVYTKGSVQIYKETLTSGFFCSYYNYYWKVYGGTDLIGPFNTIPAAVVNYEAHLQGIAKVYPNHPNVIKVDFFNKRRAK